MIAAFLYAVLASGSMVIIARGFVIVAENKNQAEAEYRYALTRLRENGESIAMLGGDNEERAGLDYGIHDGPQALARVDDAVPSGPRLCRRPVMASRRLFRSSCAPPSTSAGTMTLGEVMQAASAFVTVQTAFNWLVENYPRLADWTASARRLASLLVSLDRLESATAKKRAGHIVRKQAEDGSAPITEPLGDVGRWQCGGERSRCRDHCRREGACRRRIRHGQEHAGAGDRRPVAVGCGRDPDQIRRAVLDAAAALRAARNAAPRRDLSSLARGSRRYGGPYDSRGGGAGHFLDRLDEDDIRWEHMLSGGEKQRLAFARVLIQRPNIIVMDEATAALDPLSQERLMQLILERLPEATLVSVGHRAELEAFHTRKLVLEYHPEGARLVSDEPLQRTFRRSARFLSRLRTRETSSHVSKAETTKGEVKIGQRVRE